MKKKYFKVDSRALLTLGRDSIKDHTTAIIELVKNSYDADASRVEVHLEVGGAESKSYIRIADNGVGMDESEIDECWLRVGYSAKRGTKITKGNRRKTGEKGIGRLSADRLGEVLELKSKKSGHDSVGLRIDWSDFEVENKELSDIPVIVLADALPHIPGNRSSKRTNVSGTELTIRRLRQLWTEQDIGVLRNELSLLTSPFDRASSDFSIRLDSDLPDAQSGIVESAFVGRAEIEFDGRLSTNGTLTYVMSSYQSTQQPKVIAKGKISWNELVQRTGKSRIPNFGELGPLSIKLLFFPRRSDLLQGTAFSLSDLRNFLDKNAGVKIYRDGIRVKPYGDPDHPEGDWLSLAERRTRNPAGAGRDDFRIAPNQLVGAIFIGRDSNPKLIDSSSREGLIHGDSFIQLKMAALACVFLLEGQYHEQFKKRQGSLATTVGESAKQSVGRLNLELVSLADRLQKMKDEMPPSSARSVGRSIDQIQTVIETIDSTKRSIVELASQNTVFRGLATVGIAAAVFGHETESSISGLLLALSNAGGFLKKRLPEVEEAITELSEARTFSRKVAGWGKFALMRVKRDKRRAQVVELDALVRDVLAELKPTFAASSIDISRNQVKVRAKTYPMDIESVLINLLTNAYSACQQIKKDRKIRVELSAEPLDGVNGFRLSVLDSGRGIPKESIGRVWEPLYSTKVDESGRATGTGLGLTIVKSIVDELSGKATIDGKGELGGATFSIWLPVGKVE